jgi:hypothetical protein
VNALELPANAVVMTPSAMAMAVIGLLNQARSGVDAFETTNCGSGVRHSRKTEC